MIVEMRTYTLKPGSVAQSKSASARRLPARTKLSPLAAFWHTEVGPLNRIIHVWPYDSFEERTRIRAEVAKARGLAAQHPRIRRRAEERDLHPGAVLAEARAAPARRHLRDPHLHAGAGRDSRRRSTAGAPRSPSAPSCRRWPSPAIPSSAGSTAGATSGPTRTPPSASRSANTPARKASGRPRAGSPARPWCRRTCWSSRHRFSPLR